MGINKGVVGRRYRLPQSYEVAREKIREFAEAVKSPHRAHYELEAARSLGYEDLVAPPTFAIIVSQAVEAQFARDEETGLEFGRVVHAEQRFSHRRPIVAGDVLAAELEVTSARRMGAAGLMVTLDTEISTAMGRPVASVTSKLLVSEAAESQPGGGNQ